MLNREIEFIKRSLDFPVHKLEWLINTESYLEGYIEYLLKYHINVRDNWQEFVDIVGMKLGDNIEYEWSEQELKIFVNRY